METQRYFFQTEQLQSLLCCLQTDGYQCIGPQVRDDAIIYDEIKSTAQLPRGFQDVQAPGRYSLTGSKALKFFDWANGPQAIKPFLFAPREKLWRCEKSVDGNLIFASLDQRLSSALQSRPVAIFGVRACDVAALKIHDQHFLQQQFIDPYYRVRRENSFIIAVNCSRPAETCFCYSTGDGPFVDSGFDIALTELDDGFLCAAQTGKGEALLNQLILYTPTSEQLSQEQKMFKHAIKQQRKLPNVALQQKLPAELNSDAWEKIADRCLSCGNCTSVCPTCFCYREMDEAELDGSASSHYRQWDSCFTQNHSYIHGITIRADTRTRYRQWLTHKFSSWYQQYGRSGCVGCGRCITWCPAGIDVTVSLAEICGGDR